MRTKRRGETSSRVYTFMRSNVIGLVALFVAINSAAYAVKKAPKNSVVTKSIKSGAVTGPKVATDTLTGAKIAESTLLTVPDAAALGGAPASQFARKGLPPFTAASLQNGWVREGIGFSEPGYWVDDDGIVHIQGAVQSGTLGTVFMLPPSLRPATTQTFAIPCAGGAGQADVLTAVVPDPGVKIGDSATSDCVSYASLDGISFRPDR